MVRVYLRRGFLLLTLYAIANFVLALPDTAYTAFLKNELGMSPADQSRFYASIFVPWSLKPLYACCLATLRKRQSRAILFVSACIGSGLAYALTAAFVTTPLGALGATTFRSVCNAAVEAFLGMLLVAYVQAGEFKSTAAAQASASASRYVGSLAAGLVGIVIYGCGTTHVGSPRVVIGITAAFPLLAAAVALLSPVFDLSTLEKLPLLASRWRSRNMPYMVGVAVLVQAAFMVPFLRHWMHSKSVPWIVLSGIGVAIVLCGLKVRWEDFLRAVKLRL